MIRNGFTIGFRVGGKAFGKALCVGMLLFPAVAVGQEDFSFPIYFEDAVGHRDTVFFGYDSSATDSLDPGFGETDISQVPWDTTLDVRLAGARVWQGNGQNYQYPFQSKKLIASSQCDGSAAVFTVKILTRHWPVTARWDSTLFQGACLSTTTFSSIISDAIGSSRRVVNGGNGGFLGFIKFGGESSITFTEQTPAARYMYFYEVTSDSTRNDTLNLFWVSLSRSAFDRYIVSIDGPVIDRRDSPGLIVTGDRLVISGASVDVSDVRIFSPDGKVLAAPLQGRQIDLSTLESGVYLLRYKRNGAVFGRIFVKK